MAVLDDVLFKAKTMAEAAGKKTSEFIDLTRMKMQASDMEKEIASLLEGLGRLVYDSGKSGDDVSEAISECIAKIDEQQEELTAVRTKIDDFRNVARCNDCGVVNSDDALFCKHCGSKIN